MTPKIVAEHPPNFDDIVKVFPGAAEPAVIFAYGDTIYNPSGQPLPPAIFEHEQVHCYWQTNHNTPVNWWSLYLHDAEFRYKEELQAHVAEFMAQNVPGDRNRTAVLLMRTARRLIAPLYQYPQEFTLQKAMRDIQRQAAIYEERNLE